MPDQTLTLTVSATLYQHLQQRAKQRNRSVETETMEILNALVPAEKSGSDAIAADTATPLTVTQMAEQFETLGRTTKQQEVELSVDPDDYPLF